MNLANEIYFVKIRYRTWVYATDIILVMYNVTNGCHKQINNPVFKLFSKISSLESYHIDH